MAAPLSILIAGAGPVGLVAALRLAEAGIAVTVIERGADLAEDLRASTFHPPTLDMLAPWGLPARLIADGLIAPRTQVRDRVTGPVAEVDLSLLKHDTAYPYRVQCEQFKLSRMLRDLLAARPEAEIRFATALTAVSQDEGGVAAEVAGPAGAESLRADYLIGADGAWSQVRQSAGIAFPGFTFPDRFLVVSTAFDFADHLERLALVNYISDPEEWCVLLRVPGLWRVLLPTAPELPDAAVLDDAAIDRRLQGIVRRDRPYEIVHRTLYAVHQRVAETYRRGRVLLAGDSAHINNPLGGMGMNGGIHDAVSLTDKLIRIGRGEDGPALLDLYERQRRPVAIDAINASTAANQKLMKEKDPAVRQAALDDLRRSAADPESAYRMALKSAMIDGLRQAARIT